MRAEGRRGEERGGEGRRGEERGGDKEETRRSGGGAAEQKEEETFPPFPSHLPRALLQAQMRINCTKRDYLVQLARDKVWALRGAHCWHNFSVGLRSRALAWAAGKSTHP